MKKLLAFLLLFLSLSVLAQEKKKTNSEVQKKAFEKALTSLNECGNKQAMKHLYYAFKRGIDTKIGKLSLAKFDSILIIEKRKLLKEIQGIWVLKKTGSNWEFIYANPEIQNKIVIDTTSISFYENEKLVKKEKIKFTETTYYGAPSHTSFDYSDGQIWNYELKDLEGKMLHLKNEGYYENGVRMEISCGNTEMYYERIE